MFPNLEYKKKKKKIRTTNRTSKDLWDKNKQSNICVSEIPRRRRKKMNKPNTLRNNFLQKGKESEGKNMYIYVYIYIYIFPSS